MDAFETSARTNVPRGEFDFEHVPETDQSFENARAAARAGDRLAVAEGVELLTTGTDRPGIDPVRKEQVLEAADRRRAEVVGEEVTFVVNLNNNVTTACNTGCLFCNFKDPAGSFEEGYDPRVLYSIRQVLRTAEEELPGAGDATPAVRTATADSVMTRLVRRSLLASLTTYEVSISLFDGDGALVQGHSALGGRARRADTRRDRAVFNDMRRIYERQKELFDFNPRAEMEASR